MGRPVMRPQPHNQTLWILSLGKLYDPKKLFKNIWDSVWQWNKFFRPKKRLLQPKITWILSYCHTFIVLNIDSTFTIKNTNNYLFSIVKTDLKSILSCFCIHVRPNYLTFGLIMLNYLMSLIFAWFKSIMLIRNLIRSWIQTW